MSIASLLKGVARVDLLDVDIQGSEADTLEPAAGVLAGKVKRVCIGTHSPDNERRLREPFQRAGLALRL